MLDSLAMLCWLMKDLGWAAACWPLAVPAATLSIAMQSLSLHSVLGTKQLSCQEYAYRVAMLGWIVGNATWMMSEFMFEAMREPSRRFRWNSGPILHVSDRGYEVGLLATRVYLVSTLAFLGFFYARSALATLRDGGRLFHVAEDMESSPPRRRPIVPKDLYHVVFVTVWIIKDIFWTCESLVTALAAASFLMMLLMDSIQDHGLTAMKLAEVLWVTGNTTWFISEVWDLDEHPAPRWAACLLLLGGCTVVTISLLSELQAPGKGCPAPKSVKGSRLCVPATLPISNSLPEEDQEDSSRPLLSEQAGGDALFAYSGATKAGALPC